MAGTKIGGLKTKKKNIEKDKNFYRIIGAIGGNKKVPKGFAMMDRQKVVEAGTKGGYKSKRGKSK